MHVAKNGDKVWTIRVGTQRVSSTCSPSAPCATSVTPMVKATSALHHPVEHRVYMVTDEARSAADRRDRARAGFIVRRHAELGHDDFAHTQGWLHCDILGTDASGGQGDGRAGSRNSATRTCRTAHITTSCCQINCGGQAISRSTSSTQSRRRSTTIWLPTSRAPVGGRRAARWRRFARHGQWQARWKSTKKCICWVLCFPPCPPMQINDAEHTKLAIGLATITHVASRPSRSWSQPVSRNNPPLGSATAIVKKTASTTDGRATGSAIEDGVRLAAFRGSRPSLPTKYHIDNWRVRKSFELPPTSASSRLKTRSLMP